MILPVSHIIDGALARIGKTEKSSEKTLSSYPFGAVAKQWSNPDQTQQEQYRYGYQGQYSEYDSTTSFNAFELRMYDPIIGRWLAPDPYRQYASPYLAMGNRPVSVVDPDGGCADDDYACWEQSYWDGFSYEQALSITDYNFEVFGTNTSDSWFSQLLNAMDRFDAMDGIMNLGSISGDPGYVREGVPSTAFDFTKILRTFGTDPKRLAKNPKVAEKIKELLKQTKNANEAIKKIKLDDDLVSLLNGDFSPSTAPPRKNDVEFFERKKHTLVIDMQGSWVQVDSIFEDTITTQSFEYGDFLK